MQQQQANTNRSSAGSAGGLTYTEQEDTKAEVCKNAKKLKQDERWNCGGGGVTQSLTCTECGCCCCRRSSRPFPPVGRISIYHVPLLLFNFPIIYSFKSLPTRSGKGSTVQGTPIDNVFLTLGPVSTMFLRPRRGEDQSNSDRRGGMGEAKDLNRGQRNSTTTTNLIYLKGTPIKSWVSTIPQQQNWAYPPPALMPVYSCATPRRERTNKSPLKALYPGIKVSHV